MTFEADSRERMTRDSWRLIADAVTWAHDHMEEALDEDDAGCVACYEGLSEERMVRAIGCILLAHTRRSG